MTWLRKKLGWICKENQKSLFKVGDAINSGQFPFFTSGGEVLRHSKYLVDGENIFYQQEGMLMLNITKEKQVILPILGV